MPDPPWRDIVGGFRHAEATELPGTYRAGLVFSTPMAEMPIYLEYLTHRFEDLGGTISRKSVVSADEAFENHEIVVNCAGLGSRELFQDETMFPIRGQVVRVKQVGLERIVFDQYSPDGISYIVPRANDCILGGTAEIGDEDLTPDQLTASKIVNRCCALEPVLREAQILEHKVGLRPGRPSVKLEMGKHGSSGILVHNYGHGGAGVALSWGCADHVVSLLNA